MISEELKQEIKKEVANQIHEVEITDIKVEKLKNEILGVENRLNNKILGVENKILSVENRLDNRISKLEGMMKVIITITSAIAIGIIMLMLKDIFK